MSCTGICFVNTQRDDAHNSSGLYSDRKIEGISYGNTVGAKPCFRGCMEELEDRFKETVSGYIAWEHYPSFQAIAVVHCYVTCRQ